MNDALWEFLSAPVTGTITGLLGTVLSAMLAVYLYRRALPISRLDYASNDLVLLSFQHSLLKDDLEIRHRGKPIPQATSTVFALWNSGNETILGEQIVEADPLRFRLPAGQEILQAWIIDSTRSVVSAEARLGGSDTLTLHFDYLDRGDGFAAVVAHTGNPGEGRIEGTVRRVKHGVRRRNRSPIVKSWSVLGGIIPVVFGIFVVLAANLIPSLNNEAFAQGVLMGSIFLMAFGGLMWRQRRIWSFPKEFRKNPKLTRLLGHLADG